MMEVQVLSVLSGEVNCVLYFVERVGALNNSCERKFDMMLGLSKFKCKRVKGLPRKLFCTLEEHL